MDVIKECQSDKDCYKKGKPYCILTKITDVIYKQRCNNGFCQIEYQKTCDKKSMQCAETKTGAACVRKKSSKGIVSLFEDIFGTGDAETEIA